MSSMTIDLGGGNYLTTGAACTGIHFGNGDENHFDLDMLGDIAEWAAKAWQNVAGEEYQPVVVSPGGYVADAGEIVKRAAHLPLFADAEDSFYDDGNGLERDCE